MKKIALLGALLAGANWGARRQPTVPVPQVRALQLGDLTLPGVREQIERNIRHLATSLEEAQQQRQLERLAAQQRRRKAQQRIRKRGF